MPVTGQEFEYPGIGTVHLTVRHNTHSMTMRWRDGKIYMVVPPSATGSDIQRTLEKFKPRLLARKPSLTFHDGQTLAFDGFSIYIGRQNIRPGRIIGQIKDGVGRILISEEMDFNDTEISRGISNIACKIANTLAPEILIPRGKELASKIGISPKGWEINRGHRKLGHCTSTGIVSLSYAVMFLPQPLRDYIVCHELAHLTEMNHSPRFHALCDRYCNGNEKALTAQLRRFQWPFLM